jgi:hypothetical protein
MTDTIAIDRADSGEIPRLVIGEQRTIIMRRDTGEATQNLSPYLIPSGPFPIPLRHNDAIPESLVTGHGYDPEAHPGPIVDLVDTVTFGLAGPQSPPPPQPPAPRPSVPPQYGADETQVQTILHSLTATVDGELAPAVPPLKLRRSVPYVMPADRAPWFGPRHRKPAPLWTRVAITVGGAMAVGGSLGLAIILAVIR